MTNIVITPAQPALISVSGFIIPFTPMPQQLQVTLNNITYNLNLHWSPVSNVWLLDFSDVDNKLIVGCISLVTGADLLEQYRYLGFGGSLYAYSTEGNPDSPPTFSNLGVTAFVIFVPDP